MEQSELYQQLCDYREQIQQKQDNYIELTNMQGWSDLIEFCTSIIQSIQSGIEDSKPTPDNMLDQCKQIGIVCGIKKVLEYKNTLQNELNKVNAEIKEEGRRMSGLFQKEIY